MPLRRRESLLILHSKCKCYTVKNALLHTASSANLPAGKVKTDINEEGLLKAFLNYNFLH